MSSIDIREKNEKINQVQFADTDSFGGNAVQVSRHLELVGIVSITDDLEFGDMPNLVTIKDVPNLIKALQKVQSVLELENN